MSAEAVYAKLLPDTPDTEETLYAVPDGVKLVVGDLHYTNLDDAPATVTVRVKSAVGDGDDDSELYVSQYDIFAKQYDNLLPRGTKGVYPAGTVFKVCSSSGNVVFHLTGMES